MKCCVCRRDRDEADMKCIQLTSAEQAYVKAAQGVDASEFWYCKPCFQVLSDRHQGAQLIKGMFQVQLQAKGHPQADQAAQRMYEKLLSLSAKPRS